MLGAVRVQSTWVLVWALGVWSLTSTALAQAAPQTQRVGQTEEAQVEDASSTLPWRDSTLTFAQSLNLNSFSRTAQLSYNPTYAWTFILEPRWYFNKDTYANLDQRLYLELTDSDSTLRRQRAMLSDTVVGVDTRFLSQKLHRLGTLGLGAGLHLIAPTSLASRAATMVVGGRARARADLRFEHVLHGAALSVQGRYTHRFLRHNTLQAETPFPCLTGGLSAQNCSYLDTETNVENSLGTIVSGTLEFSQDFALSVLAWFTWSRGADLAPASITTQTGMTVALPDQSATHWRNDRYMLVEFDWNATDWLMIGISLINSFPERNANGTLRSLGKPVDTLLGLTTEISFDQLYLATTGRSSARGFED
jgi:hypothetical protein